MRGKPPTMIALHTNQNATKGRLACVRKLMNEMQQKEKLMEALNNKVRVAVGLRPISQKLPYLRPGGLIPKSINDAANPDLSLDPTTNICGSKKITIGYEPDNPMFEKLRTPIKTAIENSLDFQIEILPTENPADVDMWLRYNYSYTYDYYPTLRKFINSYGSADCRSVISLCYEQMIAMNNNQCRFPKMCQIAGNAASSEKDILPYLERLIFQSEQSLFPISYLPVSSILTSSAERPILKE